MKEQNLDKILTLLKSGRSLAKDEKDFITGKLTKYDNSEELEQAIRAFGLSNNANNENIRIVEDHLDSKSDVVISGAIKVLCSNSYWGLTEKYIERLKGFLNKQDAFELSETQIIVFSVMGEYLNSTHDVQLYEFLYQMLIKELDEYKSDRDYFQKARLERMYQCLNVGIRGRMAEFEYRVGRMEIPDDMDEEILMDVVNLIKNKNCKVK